MSPPQSWENNQMFTNHLCLCTHVSSIYFVLEYNSSMQTHSFVTTLKRNRFLKNISRAWVKGYSCSPQWWSETIINRSILFNFSLYLQMQQMLVNKIQKWPAACKKCPNRAIKNCSKRNAVDHNVDRALLKLMRFAGFNKIFFLNVSHRLAICIVCTYTLLPWERCQ